VAGPTDYQGFTAEACVGLDVQLVITTGRGVPAASLGDLPGRPVVVPYAPQLELLRRATANCTGPRTTRLGG
jgi:zeaxanthin glucosyltransferase